ncbi:MAG TPA: hypothetical protein VGC11_05580, partial [Acidimicrobiia bacterium]|jgi:hypothetical protein
MTEHEGAPESSGAPQPSAGDAMQKAMSNMVGGMSATEKLIALGAALYVVIDAILGEMILDDYGVGSLDFILSLGVLLAILRHGRGRGRWHEFYPWVVEVMAGAFAALGLWWFLDNLFDGFPGLEGSAVFYEIIYWAAIVLMGYGAWQLHNAHD